MEQPATLAQLLASLPEEERFVLTLHLLKGMAPSEIALTLGVPEKAVANLIATGKSRLFSLLDFPPSR